MSGAIWIIGPSFLQTFVRCPFGYLLERKNASGMSVVVL